MTNLWDSLQQVALRDAQQWASLAEQANRAARRDHQTLFDSFGESSVHQILERERRLWQDQMGQTLKGVAQLASGPQFDFAPLAKQAQSWASHDSLNLGDTIRGITASMAVDNGWQSIVNRDFLSPALLRQWSETARTAEQIAGIGNQLVAEIAESHAQTIRSLQGVASFFNSASLADMASRQLDTFGLGAYSTQMRNIFEHIDFDAIRSFARRSGDDLSEALDAEDDEPLTASQLHEAIEQANLAPLRQMVEEAVSSAIEKTGLAADPRRRKDLRILILYVLLPLLYCAIQVVGQPLFTRWLERHDAEASPEKARPPTYRTHFENMVVVKPEAMPLRAGPSTSERIIVTAARGQFLHVQRKKGLWLLVQYVDPTADGVSYTGWVKFKQTQRIEDETARLIWCRLISSGATPPDGCADDP